MSGRYSASHMPCRLEVQVPDTTKSSANTGAPMRSMPERNGLLSLVRPATTGSQNQGPNLPQNEGYQEKETRIGKEQKGERTGVVVVVVVFLYTFFHIAKWRAMRRMLQALSLCSLEVCTGCI